MSHRSRVQTPQGTCFVLLSAGSWSCSIFLGVFGGYGLAVYQLFAYYRQAMTWWKEGGQREDGCKRPEHISNLRSVADGLAALVV